MNVGNELKMGLISYFGVLLMLSYTSLCLGKSSINSMPHIIYACQIAQALEEGSVVMVQTNSKSEAKEILQHLFDQTSLADTYECIEMGVDSFSDAAFNKFHTETPK